MPGYDTRDDCVRRPGVRGRGHPVHRHYHGCHRATRLVEPREPPTMSTFTPMPSDTPRYLPSSVFVDDQLRRGMIPSPVKWRYYDPCRSGAHRWRFLRKRLQTKLEYDLLAKHEDTPFNLLGRITMRDIGYQLLDLNGFSLHLLNLFSQRRIRVCESCCRWSY